MKSLVYHFAAIIYCLLLSGHVIAAGGELKPRIVVLTDIAPTDVEPDDMESTVRLLAHSDLFEIEAIITGSGWNSSGRVYPAEWQKILFDIIDAYQKDLPNLMKRSGQTSFDPLEKENNKQKIGYWQSADYIRSRVFQGSPNLGVSHLGKGNNSPGSDFIIKLMEENDPRPIWILVWGGGNTIAQTLWKLNEKFNGNIPDSLIGKLRIYTITDQDVDWGNRTKYDLSSHKWMRNTFGERLFFIWDESAWMSQNWLGNSNWGKYAAFIQGKGNMGKIYPKNKYGVEGDTPSFLHVMPTGLNDPEIPRQTGWGGYFRKMMSDDSTTVCHNNSAPEIKKISEKYEHYFYPATFDNFAARMEWADKGSGNHNPIAVINGDKSLSPVTLALHPGESVVIDASQSFDPDKDPITMKWWILPEAADCTAEVMLSSENDEKIIATASAKTTPGEAHIICEVTDNGNFNLKSYRRIILSVK